jgi:hypothetical protein
VNAIGTAATYMLPEDELHDYITTGDKESYTMLLTIKLMKTKGIVIEIQKMTIDSRPMWCSIPKQLDYR